MRKLNAEDLFLLSEIVDKMDVTFPENKDKDGNVKNDRQFGVELITNLFKKIHRAKKEIITLIESVTGKKATDMSIMELKGTLQNILKQEGVLDFFKSSDT